MRDIRKIPSLRPKARRIAELLDCYRFADATRATILVLGEVDFPESHDRFLEPGVVTPATMLLARHSMGIAILIALFVVHFVCRIASGRSLPVLGTAVTALLTAGLVFRVAARCRSTEVCSADMRFAPGVVQFLRYSFPKKNTPFVRSDRIVAGTTVVALFGLPRVLGRRADVEMAAGHAAQP